MSLPSPVYTKSVFNLDKDIPQLTLPPVTIATLPERSGISSGLNSDSGTKNPSAVRSNIAILYYCLVMISSVRIDIRRQLCIQRDLGQAVGHGSPPPVHEMPAFALPHVWSDTTYAGTAIFTDALPSDVVL